MNRIPEEITEGAPGKCQKKSLKEFQEKSKIKSAEQFLTETQ